MLSIAVCDDEVIECCNMAKRIKEIMKEMKRLCIIRQFRSGEELLQALESFDIVFLDIIMQQKVVHRNLSLSAGTDRKRNCFLMIYIISG